ncbi:MAG: hypothetical protein K2O18_05270 [Oscillospiraceae bacterium]|nr:hypothetical protein [Oscillospiraceae bacterium]
MLVRLLKYDFRSMLKQFSMIWLAALALALINSFTVTGLDSTSFRGETVAGISMLVYVGVMIAMFVIAVIFVIQRFYKGLLGGEGYLMHTLPVQSWELIASKLVCAVAVTFVSIIVAIVSILLICRSFIDWDGSFFQFMGWLWKNFDGDMMNAILVLAECLLLLFTGTAKSYLLLYLAMAVGHLAHKNRAGASVAAYIGIQAACNTLIGFAGGFFNNPLFRLIQNFAWESQGWGGLHITLWIFLAYTVVIAAVYFFFTNYILKHKLNLE